MAWRAGEGTGVRERVSAHHPSAQDHDPEEALRVSEVVEDDRVPLREERGELPLEVGGGERGRDLPGRGVDPRPSPLPLAARDEALAARGIGDREREEVVEAREAARELVL